MISLELSYREQRAMRKLVAWTRKHQANLPAASAAGVIRESLRQRYSSVFSVGGSTLTNPFARA